MIKIYLELYYNFEKNDIVLFQEVEVFQKFVRDKVF